MTKGQADRLVMDKAEGAYFIFRAQLNNVLGRRGNRHDIRRLHNIASEKGDAIWRQSVCHAPALMSSTAGSIRKGAWTVGVGGRRVQQLITRASQESRRVKTMDDGLIR
jgi:hypothetical protein